jgi:hypothetical protein
VPKQITSNPLPAVNWTAVVTIEVRLSPEWILENLTEIIDSFDCSLEWYEADIQDEQAWCYLMIRDVQGRGVNITDRGLRFTFPNFTLTYGTPTQVTSNVLSLTGTTWTATIEMTFELSADEKVTIPSGKADSKIFNCPTWYEFSIQSGLAGCYPMTRNFSETTVTVTGTGRELTFAFPDFSLTYGVPKQITSNVLSLTDTTWTATIKVTFELSDDGEITIPLDKPDNETFNCPTWYEFNVQSGVAGCYLMTKKVQGYIINITDRGVTFTFPDFSLTYGVPKQITSNVLAITNWTVTIKATFSLSSSGWVTIPSWGIDDDSFNCPQWNPAIKDWVLGCYGPATTNNTMSQCSTNNYKVWSYEFAWCNLGPSSRSSSVCPSGYHVPTWVEITYVIFNWFSNRSEAINVLWSSLRLDPTKNVKPGYEWIIGNDVSFYVTFSTSNRFDSEGINVNFISWWTSSSYYRCFKN